MTKSYEEMQAENKARAPSEWRWDVWVCAIPLLIVGGLYVLVQAVKYRR